METIQFKPFTADYNTSLNKKLRYTTNTTTNQTTDHPIIAESTKIKQIQLKNNYVNDNFTVKEKSKDIPEFLFDIMSDSEKKRMKKRNQLGSDSHNKINSEYFKNNIHSHLKKNGPMSCKNKTKPNFENKFNSIDKNKKSFVNPTENTKKVTSTKHNQVNILEKTEINKKNKNISVSPITYTKNPSSNSSSIANVLKDSEDHENSFLEKEEAHMRFKNINLKRINEIVYNNSNMTKKINPDMIKSIRRIDHKMVEKDKGDVFDFDKEFNQKE